MRVPPVLQKLELFDVRRRQPLRDGPQRPIVRLGRIGGPFKGRPRRERPQQRATLIVAAAVRKQTAARVRLFEGAARVEEGALGDAVRLRCPDEHLRGARRRRPTEGLLGLILIYLV